MPFLFVLPFVVVLLSSVAVCAWWIVQAQRSGTPHPARGTLVLERQHLRTACRIVHHDLHDLEHTDDLEAELTVIRADLDGIEIRDGVGVMSELDALETSWHLGQIRERLHEVQAEVYRRLAEAGRTLQA